MCPSEHMSDVSNLSTSTLSHSGHRSALLPNRKTVRGAAGGGGLRLECLPRAIAFRIISLKCYNLQSYTDFTHSYYAFTHLSNAVLLDGLEELSQCALGGVDFLPSLLGARGAAAAAVVRIVCARPGVLGGIVRR